MADADSREVDDNADDADEEGDRLADAENDGDDVDVRDADEHRVGRDDSVVSAEMEIDAQLEEERDESGDVETRGDLEPLVDARALCDTVVCGLSDRSDERDPSNVTDIIPDIEDDTETLRDNGGDREALAELLSRLLGVEEEDEDRETRAEGDTRAEPVADLEVEDERDADAEGVR